MFSLPAYEPWQAPLTCGLDEIHLWLVHSSDLRDEDLLARYKRFLTPEEAQKQQRFYFEKDRHQYLVTRGFIRSLLTRYVPHVTPSMWRFETNKYGRPHIKADPDIPKIQFNISHTKGLVAIAIAMEREIGVDVETVTRDGDQVSIADRFFSAKEVEELHTLPASRQKDRFFDYWTLKESYIKARGMGLSIPLGDFSFILGPAPQIGIEIAEKQNDQPERWAFRTWRVSQAHKMALTVERKADRGMALRIREAVPLRESRICQPDMLYDSMAF